MKYLNYNSMSALKFILFFENLSIFLTLISLLFSVCFN